MSGWILLGVVVALGLSIAWLTNGLVARRRRIEAAWAQIDSHLRRRSELIPDLVVMVQGYATSEHESVEAITRARAAAIDAGGVAEQARAENIITTALSSLLAVAESSPDLKADRAFLSLQEELSATQGRIAYARRFYNDTVLDYNSRVRSFPFLLVAGPLRLRTWESLEVDVAPRGPVQVVGV